MSRARILADYVSTGDELALKAPITNAALVTPNLGTPSAGVMTNMTGAVTASIVDNAVTLAKMAGLARGKLIYGNASGDPTALAVGSADQVLTHDGTDLSWATSAGGGGFDDGQFLVYLSGTTTLYASGAWTVVDFTNDGTELFDSDNLFSGNNYTPTVAGKYFLFASTLIADVIDDGEILQMHIENSNTATQQCKDMKFSSATNQTVMTACSTIVSANGSSDTYRVRVNHDEGFSRNLSSGLQSTFFGGFRIA